MYRDMEYARSLIKRRRDKGEDEDDVVEEAWTFVGRDQPDPEVLTRRLSDLFPGLEQ
jgi:sterol 3beta-glucosyltransferase